jgi:endonuclease/exonuclease/phosphatase family metal-dependent hydrolase
MFSVASYNICNPQYANYFPTQKEKNHFGPQNWDKRYGDLVKNILTLNADIITLQECGDIKARLIATLPEYEVCYQPHVGRKGDGVAILYKKTRFARISEKRMDVTESNINKTHLRVDLKDNLTNRVVRIATSHLFGDPSRSTIARDHLATYKSFVCENSENTNEILVAGDFNFPIESLDFLTKRNHANYPLKYLSDGNREASEPSKNRRIDFIFKNSNTENPLLSRKVFGLRLLTDASDHLPVMTEFVEADKIKEEFCKLVKDPKMQARLNQVIAFLPRRDEKVNQDDIEALKTFFESGYGLDDFESSLGDQEGVVLPDATTVLALEKAIKSACVSQGSALAQNTANPPSVVNTGRVGTVNNKESKPSTPQKPTQKESKAQEKSGCSAFFSFFTNCFKRLYLWFKSWF